MKVKQGIPDIGQEQKKLVENGQVFHFINGVSLPDNAEIGETNTENGHNRLRYT